MIDNKITIKDDEMVNVQRGAIGHRATWTGLTSVSYTHLVPSAAVCPAPLRGLGIPVIRAVDE